MLNKFVYKLNDVVTEMWENPSYLRTDINGYIVRNYLVNMSYDDADILVREDNLIPKDKQGERILAHARRALALMDSCDDAIVRNACCNFCKIIIVRNIIHFGFKKETRICVEPDRVLWDKPWFHPNGYYIFNGEDWSLDGDYDERNYW